MSWEYHSLLSRVNLWIFHTLLFPQSVLSTLQDVTETGTDYVNSTRQAFNWCIFYSGRNLNNTEFHFHSLPLFEVTLTVRDPYVTIAAETGLSEVINDSGYFRLGRTSFLNGCSNRGSGKAFIVRDPIYSAPLTHVWLVWITVCWWR